MDQNEKLEDMIDNPTKYGFEWGFEKVSKQADKSANSKIVVCDKAPVIVHKDVALMTEHFGAGYFLASANGTSARVRDQRVVRDACADDLQIRTKTRELQRLVLLAALGQKSSRVTVVEKIVEKQVFTAIDGTTWPTQGEAMAHSIDVMQAQQDQTTSN
jgi:hypothetical protein